MTTDIRKYSNTLYNQQPEVVTLLIKCWDGDYGTIILRKGEDLDIAAERFGAEHKMDLCTINQLSDQMKQRCRIIYEFNSDEINLGKNSSAMQTDTMKASTASHQMVKRAVRNKGVMTLDSIHDGDSSSDHERNDPEDLSHNNIRHSDEEDNSPRKVSSSKERISIFNNTNNKCDSNGDDKYCNSENYCDSNNSQHGESWSMNWNDRDIFVNCRRDNINSSDSNDLRDEIKDQNYINMIGNSKNGTYHDDLKNGNLNRDGDDEEEIRQERSYHAVKSKIEKWSEEGLRSLHTTSSLSADANAMRTIMLTTEVNLDTDRTSDTNKNHVTENENRNKKKKENEKEYQNENENHCGFEYMNDDHKKIKNDNDSTYISDDDTHYNKINGRRNESDHLSDIKMSENDTKMLENNTTGRTKMLFVKKENLLSTTLSPREMQENVFARMHAQGKKNADRKEYLRTKFEGERKSLLDSKTFRYLSKKENFIYFIIYHIMT